MKREPCANRALCLWLPHWPLQRLAQSRPELKNGKIALYALVRGHARIVAAAPPAVRQGIKCGMPLVEARASGPAHFELHDPQADAAALVELAAWCEQFSPVVGSEPPDNLCLNVTGLGPLFGGEMRLAQRVAQAFTARGFVYRLAIADTLGAAWAAARFLNRHGRNAAADIPRADDPLPPHPRAAPLVVLPVGHAATALDPLPVAALRLAPAEADLLRELGIERVGQLLALPRDALVSRFGPALLRRIDQATGVVPETIVSHRPPAEIVAERQLEYPVTDRLQIEALLGELITSISRALIERRAGALQLACELRCEGGPAVTLLVGLYRATAAAKHLQELLQLQLERTRLTAPVSALRVGVAASAPLECSQQELFEPSGRAGQRQMALLIDRLSSRLGRESVVRPVALEEAQPELAVGYRPLALASPSRKEKPLRGGKHLPRPLHLESEPRALSVVSVIPDGPPIQFMLDGLHRVAKAWGPERIQTGWWRGRYIQRDYYRVETTAGRRFWLFRRLPDGIWFLHGVFD